MFFFMIEYEFFFRISQVVVNTLERFYLILQELFEHVNVRYHLYQFYKDD